MIAGLRKHTSSFKVEKFDESESEDDSISSASAKSFTLEMPIENQEGESELQEDSSKVNTENSEMAPKPKRQRKSRGVNLMGMQTKKLMKQSVMSRRRVVLEKEGQGYCGQPKCWTI